MSPVRHTHDDELMRGLHERPQKGLEEWVAAPAHIHHTAYRLSDPPAQRPRSREEFRQLLHCLDVPEAASVIAQQFGYGVKTGADGDRLIVVWEAHTEYYSYQLWHVPADPATPLAFGPLAFEGYAFPFSPLGVRVNALDLLVATAPPPFPEELRAAMPGRVVYGSRVFGGDLTVLTTFTPDEQGRERYLAHVPEAHRSASVLMQLVETLVRIETYYHLILMQRPKFAAAVDETYRFEQHHMRQREIITGHLGSATAPELQRWLNHLTEDLMRVNRLAGTMQYELSAAVPYDRIVQASLGALKEAPLPRHRPLSDYLIGGVSGVADGYQQLLRRIDTLKGGFEGIISILRARVDLLLEGQNLALLSSVAQTTRSQVILQHTVEGLSIIVIAYYLSGLAGYLFKGLQEAGWLRDATIATALFVPIAIGLSFALTHLSRALIRKRLSAGDKR